MVWQIFPEDAKQALRLRRFFMAALAYFIWLSLAFYCYYLGLLDVSPRVLVWCVILTLLTNLLWFGLLRSGINLYWPDPSLTLPQMIVATFWVMLVVWATPAARGSMLLLYMVVFLFGVFRLRRLEYLALTGLALLGYGLILVSDLYRQVPRVPLHLGLLQYAVLAVALVWLAFFGSYVGRLRATLARRNAELAGALAKNRELALHDDLTGAYNRRYLMQLLEQERERVRRTQRSFSVCLLDIDHFKRINDEHGHLAGDDILEQFAEHVTRAVRSLDLLGHTQENGTFARYGGEEFLLILPETGMAGAQRCAERIRESLTAARFITDSVQLGVSVSVGVTEYRPEESIRELLKRADRALYRAKQNGRNRVEAIAVS